MYFLYNEIELNFKLKNPKYFLSNSKVSTSNSIKENLLNSLECDLMTNNLIKKNDN